MGRKASIALGVTVCIIACAGLLGLSQLGAAAVLPTVFAVIGIPLLAVLTIAATILVRVRRDGYPDRVSAEENIAVETAEAEAPAPAAQPRKLNLLGE